MPVRLGELLLKEKRISPAQLQETLTFQKSNGGKLAFNLVKLGFIKDDEITALLSKQYGVPSINLSQFEIDPSIAKLIPAETAHKYQIVPLSRSGATLTIAMTDPTNVFAMDDIKFMTGYNVEPVVASEAAVADAIQRYFPLAPAGRPAEKKVEKKEKKIVSQQEANLTSAASLEMVTRALEETAAIVDDDVELLEEME
ncbi:MAG TPA: hypothetical protein VH458_21860, partial [Vicinamibacterales bacterium]